MPWDDQGLFLTLAINVVVTCVMLLLLLCLHRRQFFRLVYHPRRLDPEGTSELYAMRSPLSLLRFLGIKEWLARCGGDYAALLHLQSCFLKVIGIYGVLALLLIPVNVTDNYREELAKSSGHPYIPGIEDLTMYNVHPKSWRLWLHTLASIILSLLIWRLLYEGLALLYDFKNHIVPDPVHWSTAFILDSTCHTPQQVLATHFPRNITPTVVSRISIPRKHPSEYDDLVDRRKEAIRKLHHAYAYLASKKEHQLAHPVAWKLWTKKADAISLWTAEIGNVDAELLLLAERYKGGPPAGPIFITFPSVQDHLIFRRWRHSIQFNIGTCYVAPVPSDILWANLHHGWTYQQIGRLIALGLFSVLLLFWSVPIAFLSSLGQIASIPVFGQAVHYILTLNTTVAGLLQAYLPVIILALFNLLLPLICRKLANLGAPYTHSSLDRCTFKGYFMFVFSVLLLTAIFGAGFQGLAVLLVTLNLENVLNLLVRIVSPKVGFFMARVISATFIEMWVPALRLGAIVTAAAKGLGAISIKEKREIYEVVPPGMWLEYVDPLLTLSIVLVFGVTLPIIPIVGALYFYVKMVRDQYLFTHVYPKQPASQLRLLPIVLHFVLLALDVHQWGMLGLLAVKAQWICFGLYAPFPLMSFFAHLVLLKASAVVFLNLEEVSSGEAVLPRPGGIMEWVVTALEYSHVLLPLRTDDLSPGNDLEDAQRVAPQEQLAHRPKGVVRLAAAPLTADAYQHPLESYEGSELNLDDIQREAEPLSHESHSPIYDCAEDAMISCSTT